MLTQIKDNPFYIPPPFKELVGNKAALYSRRINIQHRLVYSVDETNKEVFIHSMWSLNISHSIKNGKTLTPWG